MRVARADTDSTQKSILPEPNALKCKHKHRQDRNQSKHVSQRDWLPQSLTLRPLKLPLSQLIHCNQSSPPLKPNHSYSVHDHSQYRSLPCIVIAIAMIAVTGTLTPTVTACGCRHKSHSQSQRQTTSTDIGTHTHIHTRIEIHTNNHELKQVKPLGSNQSLINVSEKLSSSKTMSLVDLTLQKWNVRRDAAGHFIALQNGAKVKSG